VVTPSPFVPLPLKVKGEISFKRGASPPSFPFSPPLLAKEREIKGVRFQKPFGKEF